MAMKFTFLIEIMIGVIFLWFIVFQILVPGFRGTPFFPILRAKPRAALGALSQAREEHDIGEIERETAAIRSVQSRPEADAKAAPAQTTQPRGRVRKQGV